MKTLIVNKMVIDYLRGGVVNMLRWSDIRNIDDVVFDVQKRKITYDG